MNEFDMIKKYFSKSPILRTDVSLGIGDDAAIVNVPKGFRLAITTDTLINGVHFPDTTLPEDIGYKSLAVNLSDLAAMGAHPAFLTLSLTLPKAEEEWLQRFCQGFFNLAARYNVQLIGGDLTRGPLSITVEAMGFLPEQEALLRSQAKSSDLIYVTGTLGDASLALSVLQKKLIINPLYQKTLFTRLNRPEPRITTGEKLLSLAHAAIDISDGLAADLSHILEASKVGAILYVDQLPLSHELTASVSPDKAISLALTGGDDYELCFTVSAEKRVQLEKQLASTEVSYTCIGKITKDSKLLLQYQNGNPYHGLIGGYEHF